MLDEWIEFDSTYCVAGKFSLPAGTKFPAKQTAKGTLWCRMSGKGRRPDAVCRYEGVPYILWEQLLAAESKGKFHWAAIRHLDYATE